jgi:hypothetical protein
MRTLLELLKPYRKAILSGVIAAVFAALPLVGDGITAAEAALIIGAGLSGAGVVYRVPNVPASQGQHKAG